MQLNTKTPDKNTLAREVKNYFTKSLTNSINQADAFTEQVKPKTESNTNNNNNYTNNNTKKNFSDKSTYTPTQFASPKMSPGFPTHGTLNLNDAKKFEKAILMKI